MVLESPWENVCRHAERKTSEDRVLPTEKMADYIRALPCGGGLTACFGNTKDLCDQVYSLLRVGELDLCDFWNDLQSWDLWRIVFENVSRCGSISSADKDRHPAGWILNSETRA